MVKSTEPINTIIFGNDGRNIAEGVKCRGSLQTFALRNCVTSRVEDIYGHTSRNVVVDESTDCF